MMARIDTLAPGTHFRLPATGLEGVLLQVDTELGTGADVQVRRPRPARTFTDSRGKVKSIAAGWDRDDPTVWSCGTMVEVIA